MVTVNIRAIMLTILMWQDLVKWKNRRRSASQELIKKEEERKRMEKKLKEESDRRKSIKTYKEIVEEK